MGFVNLYIRVVANDHRDVGLTLNNRQWTKGTRESAVGISTRRGNGDLYNREMTTDTRESTVGISTWPTAIPTKDEPPPAIATFSATRLKLDDYESSLIAMCFHASERTDLLTHETQTRLPVLIENRRFVTTKWRTTMIQRQTAT